MTTKTKCCDLYPCSCDDSDDTIESLRQQGRERRAAKAREANRRLAGVLPLGCIPGARVRTLRGRPLTGTIESVDRVGAVWVVTFRDAVGDLRKASLRDLLVIKN